MATQETDLNPYELLGVDLESTETEIKTAYRQRSLKVHPDRHPNNPDAANKFHELNQAYELLLDPIRKTSLDASLRVKQARKARFAKFDVKRKGMQDELEAAERAVKRAKRDKEKEEREKMEEAERIKEEGRRMRSERQEEVMRKEEGREQQKAGGGAGTQLGPLDTTIRVKYPLSQHPTLTTPSSLSALLSTFGPIDQSSIVISMKPSKKTPQRLPKHATALVPFRHIGDALAAVCASGKENRGLKDIIISWAEGKEPAVLELLKRQDRASSPRDRESPTSTSHNQPHLAPRASSTTKNGAADRATFLPSFSFDPTESQSATDHHGNTEVGLDYESLTLMRLRQAERERLEREIREQETVS